MKENIKKIILFIFFCIYFISISDAVFISNPATNILPSKTGNADKFLQVSSDEQNIQWTTFTASGIVDIARYSGTSVSATNSLNLSPDFSALCTLSGTGTLKFIGDFSCTTSNDFSGFNLEGFMVRDTASGVRFVGVNLRKRWEISSGTFGITASCTSSGLLQFLASGPAGLKAYGNVIISKVLF